MHPDRRPSVWPNGMPSAPTSARSLAHHDRSRHDPRPRGSREDDALALSIGYAVASGRPLMRWNVERRGRVLYVDGELPGTLLQRRLQKLGLSLPQSDFRVLARSQFEWRGAKFPDRENRRDATLSMPLSRHARSI